MYSLRRLNSAAFEHTPAHVAVLDEAGDIVLWNRAWDRFAAENGAAGTDWRRFNYADVCRRAATLCRGRAPRHHGVSSLPVGRTSSLPVGGQTRRNDLSCA